jgi:hypothetical protein
VEIQGLKSQVQSFLFLPFALPPQASQLIDSIW